VVLYLISLEHTGIIRHDTCQKHRVAPGLHCASAEEALHRIEEGWQFIAIGSEPKMMLNGVNEVVQKLGIGPAKRQMARY
jgi:4-hydroxy-2-oxoheptanedioate aldolase